ncbi:uncharacterized protein LOC144723067 [Lampetra planeri]
MPLVVRAEAEPSDGSDGGRPSTAAAALHQRLPPLKEFVGEDGDWGGFQQRFLAHQEMAQWTDAEALRALPALLDSDALATLTSSTPTYSHSDERPARRRPAVLWLQPPSRRRKFAPSTVSWSGEREYGRLGMDRAASTSQLHRQRSRAATIAASGVMSPRDAALLGSAGRRLDRTRRLLPSSNNITRCTGSDGLTPDNPSWGCRGSRGNGK